jgi:hypothetical protein
MSLIFRSRSRVMRMATAGRSGTVPVAPSPEVAAVAQLRRLHESGALSDADFASARRAALRRVPPDRAPPA